MKKLFLLFTLLIPAMSFAQTSHKISAYVVSSGGGASAGGGHILYSAIAQPFVGRTMVACSGNAMSLSFRDELVPNFLASPASEIAVPNNFTNITVEATSNFQTGGYQAEPNSMVITWQDPTGSSYTLQQSLSLSPPNWVPYPGQPQLVPGTANTYTVTISTATGTMFFRLEPPCQCQ